MHNRTWFAWGFNQQITSHDEDKTRGMSVFGNMSIADQRSDVKPYCRFTTFAIVNI